MATSYLGIWRLGSGDQWWVSGVRAAEFKARDADHFASGLRLVNFTVRDDGITAVWQPGAGDQWVHWDLDADVFTAQDRAYFGQGLRLQDLCLYGDGRFAGVWRPGNGDQWARWGLTAEAFAALDQEFFATACGSGACGRRGPGSPQCGVRAMATSGRTGT